MIYFFVTTTARPLTERGGKVCRQEFHPFNDGLHAICRFVVEKQSQKHIAIVLAGGSCSGKSYLSRRLKMLLADLGELPVILKLDDYMKEIDDPTLPVTKTGAPLFDAPESYRMEEAESHLHGLIEGKPIEGPVYDLDKNQLVPGKTETKYPERVIIVDGLFAVLIAERLAVPTLRVFVEATPEVRLQRRIERDAKRFGVEQALIERVFWSVIQPAHVRFIEPQKNLADLVILSE